MQSREDYQSAPYAAGTGVSRRTAIVVTGMALFGDAMAVRRRAAPQSSGCALIEALEEHGLIAYDSAWGMRIHRSMGAQDVQSGCGKARGPDRAEQAALQAIERLWDHFSLASGVTVVAAGTPTSLREAKQAFDMVRGYMPLDAYGAFSTLDTSEYGSELVVAVALGRRSS